MNHAITMTLEIPRHILFAPSRSRPDAWPRDPLGHAVPFSICAAFRAPWHRPHRVDGRGPLLCAERILDRLAAAPALLVSPAAVAAWLLLAPRFPRSACISGGLAVLPLCAGFPGSPGSLACLAISHLHREPTHRLSS